MRRQGIWTYFLSLICVIGLSVALLPACGGGGGSEDCNSTVNNVEGFEAECDIEEDAEEVDIALEEGMQEDSEGNVLVEDEEELDELTEEEPIPVM